MWCIPIPVTKTRWPPILETIVENRRLQELIHEVKVPVEMVPELKDGVKERNVERKLFPRLRAGEDGHDRRGSWYVVRNCRGVTGFVGSTSSPSPFRKKRWQSIGVEAEHELTVDYAEGDNVEITAGPWRALWAWWRSIDLEKQKVRVKVSMFGRETRASWTCRR